MNHRITSSNVFYTKLLRVRVIDTDGKQLGVFSRSDALRLAEEKEQDLVEIAPQATPPVCKIINYSYNFV